MFKTNQKKTSAPAGKQPEYIYTEADLGEGILDEGVYVTYKITKRQSKVTGVSVNISEPLKKHSNLKIPNVAEDFSYAYYGY